MTVPPAPRAPASVRLSTPAGQQPAKAAALSEMMRVLETTAIFAAYHKEQDTQIKPEMQKHLDSIESRLSEMVTVGRQITSEFNRRRDEFLPAHSSAPDFEEKNDARLQWENAKSLEIAAILRDLKPDFDAVRNEKPLNLLIAQDHQLAFSHIPDPNNTSVIYISNEIDQLVAREKNAAESLEKARNEHRELGSKAEGESPGSVERTASYLNRAYNKEQQPFDPAINFEDPYLTKSTHSLKVQQRSAAERQAALVASQSDPWAERHKRDDAPMSLA